MRLSQVRLVFRLLGEVRDLGAAPNAWRRRMLDGLLRLVGGATGVAAEAIIPKKAGNNRIIGLVIEGVSDQRLVAIYRALIERGGYSLDLRREGLANPTNATVARTRQQMAENRAWRHRPDLDPWRTLHCEYFICSNRYLPRHGCVHLIILTRSAREQPFDELERRLVALFHEELGRLWRQSVDESGTQLSLPLQETLEFLLDGASEKQIVARLGLSPHTVHDRVKRLYRRFHVNSRAQLLARLSHSPLVRAPQLSVSLAEDGGRQPLDLDSAVEGKSGPAACGVRSIDPSLRAVQA